MVALLDGISTGINRVKSNPSYREMDDKLGGGKTLQDLVIYCINIYRAMNGGTILKVGRIVLC